MRKKSSRPYRRFSPEFKDEAVKMVLEQKRRKAEVARELEIASSMLDSWIEKYLKTGAASTDGRSEIPKRKNEEKTRIKQLEKELEELKMERDILKKAAAYFAKDIK